MAVTQENTPVIKMATEGDAISDVLADPVVDIQYLHWISKGATVGDDLLVSDGAGNVIWEEVADIVNCSKTHPIKHPVDDLTVTTLDTGTLYAIKAPADGWPG